MGTTPRIGRNTKSTTTTEPDVETAPIEALNPSEYERTLGSFDAIVQHREQEHDAMLLALRGPAAPATGTLEAVPAQTSLANEIAANIRKMSEAEAAQRQAVGEARVGANRSTVAPLLDRLATAKRGIRALRDEHLTLAAELAAIDVTAFIRRTRAIVTPGSSMDSHQRLGLLQRVAQQAVEAMRQDFGTADDAVARMELSMTADPASQEFRSGFTWLERMVRRVEDSFGAATKSLASMMKLQDQVQTDMKAALPVQPEPLPEKVMLPRIENPPAPLGGSSIPDWAWDVRDISTYREPGKGDTPMERIDDSVGGGHRVGALPNPGTKGVR
jgi:phage shock protein A